MQFTAGALGCGRRDEVAPDRSWPTRRRIHFGLAGRRCRRPAVLLQRASDITGSGEHRGGLVDMLFVPLVLTLAIGAGSLPSAAVDPVDGLSAGRSRFASTWSTSWCIRRGYGPPSSSSSRCRAFDSVGKLIVVGVLTITVGAAIVLFHFVEEPARRWMRRMVDVSGPNADARTDPAAHAATGKLQSVDRALEARSKSISARAG